MTFNQQLVLNVAEKNSVAKEVTRLLNRGQLPQEVRSDARYCRNWKFPFQLNGHGDVEMVFSSVMGHLLQLDFEAPYKKWSSCAPQDLYHVRVKKDIGPGEELPKVKRNLQNLARKATMLVLWLDCDREGENIAFEVIQVCTEVNPRLVVKRARFSALIPRDIFHAINNLVEPNRHEADAVDARQEIDLRIGASFTRLQTLLLQSKFNWSAVIHDPRFSENMLLSYGPCQFPTLGLIVQREWEIQSHVHEAFFTINVFHPTSNTKFTWHRGNLFDERVARMYHDICTERPEATVEHVTGSQRRRYAPVPLCTLEMQKKGSQYLRMSGERIMKIAEELYQGGYVSYPRTETTLYKDGYDLEGLVRKQTGGGGGTNRPWSAYAERLLAQGQFRWPQSGGKDDGAHPPIHPTKPYDAGGDNSNNNGEKARVYEFIVRHFLASCSPDALGQETKIGIVVSSERFKCTGLMVLEKNWLDVFPWAKWGGSEALPKLEPGQRFTPRDIQLHQGRTEPPARMRETDLLAKMDAYGIGTDATVADHIAKQLDRGYATKDEGNLTFAPTPLGESLISAYRKMGLESLWLPTLRGSIEQNIAAVARGAMTKERVLEEAIRHFGETFRVADQRKQMLVQEVRSIVFSDAVAAAPQQQIQGDQFALCPNCTVSPMVITRTDDGLFCATCSAVCEGESKKFFFPRMITRHVSVTQDACMTPECLSRGCTKLVMTLVGQFPNPHSEVARRFQEQGGRASGCLLCDRPLIEFLRSLGATLGRRGGDGGPGGGGRGGGGRRGAAGGGASRGRTGRGSRAERGGRGGRGRGRRRRNQD